MLEKGLDLKNETDSRAYVTCGKTQLDEVIKGMEAPKRISLEIPEDVSDEEAGQEEEALDAEAEAAKEELGI